MPIGGEIRSAKVKRRLLDDSGNPTGVAHVNPLLDTRQYLLEFDDGRTGTYDTNTLAENLLTMCDPEGNEQMLFDSIIDHRTTDDAVPFDERFVSVNGKQHKVVTTKGWELCVQWKNKSTTWKHLADLKESFPLYVAEYAVSRGIDTQAAFHWWVPYVLKRMVKAVCQRY